MHPGTRRRRDHQPLALNYGVQLVQPIDGARHLYEELHLVLLQLIFPWTSAHSFRPDGPAPAGGRGIFSLTVHPNNRFSVWNRRSGLPRGSG
jgi:hypothetical protein